MIVVLRVMVLFRNALFTPFRNLRVQPQSSLLVSERLHWGGRGLKVLHKCFEVMREGRVLLRNLLIRDCFVKEQLSAIVWKLILQLCLSKKTLTLIWILIHPFSPTSLGSGHSGSTVKRSIPNQAPHPHL